MVCSTYPSVLGEHVTLDATRGDTVDSDTARAKVSGESLDHANDSHLGSVVKSVVADTKKASSNGRHEDQASVVLEVLPRGLADEELCAGVEVEDVVVLLLGDLLGLVPALGAGVAHDNVDLAEVLLGLLAHLVGGFLAVGVVDYDAGATATELNGAATTDTTAGTGDEGDLSMEGGGKNGDGALRHDGGVVVVVEVV
jgi:hypothetical protein